VLYVKKQRESYLELKMSPPLDQNGQRIDDDDFVECPILFKLVLKGRWSLQSWIDMGDIIRVIGSFNQENGFSLTLDDEIEAFSKNSKTFGLGPLDNKKASLMIVEPYIMIPVT
jgi:hypothetical protein